MNRSITFRILGGLLFCGAAAAPAHATIISVNSVADTVADDGQCTLREAMTAANENKASGTASGECSAGQKLYPGLPYDVIRFQIKGTGPFTFSPATPLPAVTEAVIIDGYSQPGAKPNKQRSGSDAVLMLELRGDAMTPFCDPYNAIAESAAFQFLGPAASHSRLRGFAIGGFADPNSPAVVIFRAHGVQIDGNFIGFDAAGNALGNANAGIMVLNGAYTQVGDPPKPFDDGGNGNLIGGTSPAERNVVANSLNGVLLGGQNNRVQGNYVGVDPAGTTPSPNAGHGVLIGAMGVATCDKRTGYMFVGAGNVIGGGSSGAANFLSADAKSCAVNVRGAGNDVRGNLIGTDRDGGPGPTGSGIGAQADCGVLLDAARATDNTVVYNTIAFNRKGVVVKTGGGPAPVRNDIRANSIHSNTDLGIDLEDDGVTANDADDKDGSANGLQNFPERLAATPSGVRGVAVGVPNVEQRIDFYQGLRCSSSGNGEGERYLGSTTVLPDARGMAPFSVSLPGLQIERVVTATATTAPDGTSEFSECARVLSGLSLTVEVQSSVNPARSRETYQLTVLVRGSGGTMPTGRVTLYDTAHTSPGPTGQPVFHALGSETLSPSATLPDTAFAVFDSQKLQRTWTQWGNLPVRAQYSGDATYASTASPDFVQTVYREKSDLDGDGLTDLVLCDRERDKYLVQDVGGSFTNPVLLPGFGADRTVLGTAEFGLSPQPAVVWHDTSSGTVGGTTFAGGTPQQDFTIPLPTGLTFEAVGSMYGDLKDDVIARDATGQHFGLLTTSIGSNGLGFLQPWPVDQPTSYTVGPVGDFNGDGNLDWQLENPALMARVLWMLDGAFRVATRGALPTPMSASGVAATGDFDGDGRTDFVWTFPNGSSQISLQNGLSSTGSLPLSQTVVGTGYFDDGTGRSGGRSSLIVRDPVSGRLDVLVNTGVSNGLPVFGQVRTIPAGGLRDLTVCVP